MVARMQLFQSMTGAKLDPGIEFVESVQMLLHATDGDPMALDELGDLLTKDVGSERVRALVDTALKGRLRQFAKRLDERFKGSQWLRLLLTPVGQLPYDALDWSWNQAEPRRAEPRQTEPRQAEPSEDDDGIHFTLGGSSGRGAVIGRTPENDLQYCFDVLVAVAGQLRTPFSFDATTTGGSRALLDFRFEHPSHVLLHDALANDLPRLVHLLEPDQLPDSNLKSIELDIEGQVLLAARASTATSWSTLRDLGGEALSAPHCIAANVRYDLEWVFPGHFKLQLKPDNLHGTVIASLIAVADGALPRVLEFGGNLTSRGLERVVRPLLEHHSPVPGELIEFADRYGRPRELMQEHLEQTLNAHASLTQELGAVLSAVGSARNTTQAFVEQVSIDAVSLLDQRPDLWQPLLEGECAPAAAYILERVEIADDLRRLARRVLRQWLDGASAALRGELCEELEELLDDDKDSCVLKALGGTAGARAAELTKQLVVPCIEFIAQVRRSRQKLLDAAEASIADTMGLELAHIARLDRHEQVLLEISMNPRNEEARRLYEQILIGDFREVLARALDPGQPHITLERGLLTETLRIERQTTFCFDLVGVDGHALDLLDEALVVEHVAGGVIRVAGSSVSLDSSATLAPALCLPDPLAILVEDRAPVILAVRPQGLQRAAVQAHLSNLEDAGLVVSGALSAAVDSLGIDDPRHLRANVLCALSRQELERACARDPRDVERVTIEEQLRILDACLPQARGLAMILDELREGEGIAFVRSQVGASLHQVRQALDAGSSSSPGTRSRSLAELVHSMATNVERMQAYLGILGSLWAMDLDTVHRGSRVPERKLMKLEALRDEIDDLARGWRVLPDALAYGSYAFITSLRRLAGIDRTRHPLTPTMRWTAHGRLRHHIIA